MRSLPLALCVAIVTSIIATGLAVSAEAETATQPTTQPSVRGISPSAAYPDIYASADLVTGGTLVPDPLDKSVRYYVAPEYVQWKPENVGKKGNGLFISFDEGSTWRVLSRTFKFQFLFVHSLDGRLYAIIDHKSFKTQEDGFLQRGFSDKIIVSEDGKRWKDITRGPGFVADLVSIFQDPDHPNRVCVGASVIRYCVIQYVDDEYSDWTWFHGSERYKKHPSVPKD